MQKKSQKKSKKKQRLPKIGGVWKFPGYREGKITGDYYIMTIENIDSRYFHGTVLYSNNDSWKEGCGVAVGNYISTKRHQSNGMTLTNNSYVCASKEEFFEDSPHMIPVKEVEKIVEVEKLVDHEVRVIAYHETWIDYLYNWYCHRKARNQEETV